MPVPSPNEPTRSSLLHRLRDWDDRESWQDFFDSYWKLIYSVSVKAGLSDSDAQDVVQESLLEAAKQLPKFQYDRTRGSFKGWLMRLVRWKIIAQFRKNRRAGASVSETPPVSNGKTDAKTMIDQVADPDGLALEWIWDHEWRNHLLERAMGRVKRRVRGEHWRIYYLHVIKEQSVEQVCRALNVSRTRVYVVRHRLEKLLRDEVTSLRSTTE